MSLLGVFMGGGGEVGSVFGTEPHFAPAGSLPVNFMAILMV